MVGLFKVTAAIGLLMAITKALFSNSFEYLALRFFLPLFVFGSLMVSVKAPVKIEDALTRKFRVVDNVPFVLAKFSQVTSTIGYKISHAIESVMHTNSDRLYEKSGMIFGADNLLEIERYEITDPDLKRNLRNFSKQCLMYDLQIGKYSLDDVFKSEDIWKFLEDNTSKTRMLKFFDFSEGKNKKSVRSYKSCPDSLKLMAPVFQKQKNYYAKQEILSNIPNIYEALTGIQKDSKEIIGQQIMSNFLNGKFGRGLSEDIAYQQQKKTYQIMGGLASKSIVTLRTVLEALLIASFLFVVPLALLPGGIKYLSQWCFLLVWIQLWPPFFTILHFISQIVAMKYTPAILDGCGGISYFASVGLNNLYQDIYAVSGYLQASIPFISYAIVKGGAGAFVHMAGSLMTPGHSAASSAAAEETRGNFSFANTSFGQMSYNNTSGFQHNTSGSYANGFISMNDGRSTSTFARGGGIVHNTHNSHLREDLFNDHSVSNQIQESLSRAELFSENKANQFLESVSTSGRHLSDLTNHMSHAENFNTNFSERESLSIQESARYMENLADNLSKTHGISKSESFSMIAAAGNDSLPLLPKASANYNSGSSNHDALSEVSQIAKSEEFSKHFGAVKDFAETKSGSFLNDEGIRISENFSKSSDTMRSSQESFSASLSKVSEIRDSASRMESDSLSFRENLNDEFVNWSSKSLPGGYGQFKQLELNNREEMHQLRDSFLSQKFPTEQPTLEGFIAPQKSFEGANVSKLDSEHGDLLVSQDFESNQQQTGLSQTNVSGNIRSLETSKGNYSDVGENLQKAEENISRNEEQLSQDFQTMENQGLVSNSVKQPIQRVWNTVEQAWSTIKQPLQESELNWKEVAKFFVKSSEDLNHTTESNSNDTLSWLEENESKGLRGWFGG